MHKERPLSPHLQAYNMLQVTSILSILHRACGVFLALGSPVLIYWLYQLSSGIDAYQSAQTCFSHWLFQVFLLGWTFALFYHFSNGIRHLFWDIGKGFELDTLKKSGCFVVVFATLLTAITVYLAYCGGV